MKLRKVYNVSVSSTICQECETCFTEEPQTANDACNEFQTNVSHPSKLTEPSTETRDVYTSSESSKNLWNKGNRHNQDELQWMTGRAEDNVIK